MHSSSPTLSKHNLIVSPTHQPVLIQLFNPSIADSTLDSSDVGVGGLLGGYGSSDDSSRGALKLSYGSKVVTM